MLPRSNIRVYCRARPVSLNTSSGGKVNKSVYDYDENLGTIVCHPPKGHVVGDVLGTSNDIYRFSFDGLFVDNGSQQEVFERCGSSLVQSCVEGYNGTLMAYGQTSSGKTYSMTGLADDYNERGIIPRAISKLFQTLQSRTDLSYQVTVSYLEIYNETLFDLLAAPTDTMVPVRDAPNLLTIQEDVQGQISVRNMTNIRCATEADALLAFFSGNNRRATAPHALNQLSTRSHAIFTISLETKYIRDSAQRITRSKLQLVDLAGSERIKKTAGSGSSSSSHLTTSLPMNNGTSTFHTPSNVGGSRLKEAQQINKSLCFLEHVVSALNAKAKNDAGVANALPVTAGNFLKSPGSSPNRSPPAAVFSSSPVTIEGGASNFIPYRSSKLTHLLKDSVGGNCQTVVIANLRFEEAFFDETLSTLRFATRLAAVKNSPRMNSVGPSQDQYIKQLEREIQVLRQDLQIVRSSVPGATGGAGGGGGLMPASPEEMKILMGDVQKFLDEPMSNQFAEVPNLTSLRRCKEALQVARELYQKQAALYEEALQRMAVEGGNQNLSSRNTLGNHVSVGEVGGGGSNPQTVAGVYAAIVAKGAGELKKAAKMNTASLGTARLDVLSKANTSPQRSGAGNQSVQGVQSQSVASMAAKRKGLITAGLLNEDGQVAEANNKNMTAGKQTTSNSNHHNHNNASSSSQMARTEAFEMFKKMCSEVQQSVWTSSEKSFSLKLHAFEQRQLLQRQQEAQLEQQSAKKSKGKEEPVKPVVLDVVSEANTLNSYLLTAPNVDYLNYFAKAYNVFSTQFNNNNNEINTAPAEPFRADLIANRSKVPFNAFLSEFGKQILSANNNTTDQNNNANDGAVVETEPNNKDNDSPNSLIFDHSVLLSSIDLILRGGVDFIECKKEFENEVVLKAFFNPQMFNRENECDVRDKDIMRGASAMAAYTLLADRLKRRRVAQRVIGEAVRTTREQLNAAVSRDGVAPNELRLKFDLATQNFGQLRSDMAALEQSLQLHRQNLLSAFDAWFKVVQKSNLDEDEHEESYQHHHHGSADMSHVNYHDEYMHRPSYGRSPPRSATQVDREKSIKRIQRSADRYQNVPESDTFFTALHTAVASGLASRSPRGNRAQLSTNTTRWA